MSRVARAALATASRWVVATVGVVLTVGTTGCLTHRTTDSRSASLHLSEVALEGDARRQASLRLVMDALEADTRKETQRARGLYARALQLDSGNPYAYLALARHHAAVGDAALVLEHLARSEDLLGTSIADSPRVEVHLVGLRGVALQLAGRGAEAARLLDRAARAAPSVWGDGRLTAQELR